MAITAFSAALRRRRVVVLALVAVGAYALVGGIAEATGGPVDSTPSVYSAVAPFTVLHAKAVAPGASVLATVSGASTGVPANATSVTMTAAVAATTGSGTVTVFPAGIFNAAQPAVQFQSGQAGSAQVTSAVSTNRVTFKNTSAAPVTLTVSVIGYYAPAGATGPAGGVLTGNYPNPGLGPNVVTSGNIAGGAAGQLLGSNGTNAQWVTPNYASALTNSIVVHTTPDATANADALRAAVASATAAIVMEPGTYDLGSTGLTTVAPVDIVGAGSDSTKINYSGSGTAITLGADATVSNLSLLDDAGAAQSIGIKATAGVVTLRQVEVTIENGTASEIGVDAGAGADEVDIDDSTIGSYGGPATTFSEAVLNNLGLTISRSFIAAASDNSAAPAVGVNTLNGAVIMNSQIYATGAFGGAGTSLLGQGDTPVTADDDELIGSSTSVSTNGGLFEISGSELGGTTHVTGSGAVACVYSYDTFYAPLSSSCT